jgi:McrBC 5-methylcytosine restriction system component
MRNINLREYECSDILDSKFLHSFKDFLQHKHLEDAFSFELDQIRASSYIGAVKFKQTQINVLPKVLSCDEDRKNTLHNLIFMLSYVNKLKIKDSGLVALSKAKNPFLEVLITFFADSLLDALLADIPHNYESQNENLKFIKGKIDFKNHIKHNSFNNAKIFCLFDEFKEDNKLNQFFKFISYALMQLSNVIETKNKLKNILDIYSEVSDIRITEEISNTIKINRWQQSFAQPLKLAKLFLANSSINMCGNSFETIAILFDMNVLFEEFVFEALKELLPDKYKIESQKQKRIIDGLYSAFMEPFVIPFKISTRTDILITVPSGQKIIVDTKYKLIDFYENKNPSAGDIYQMMAYSKVYNVENVILLYPQ